MSFLLARLLRWTSFRGKGRIASRLPVPHSGIVTVGFPHGLRLELDLRDPAQHDYLVGMYDQHELRLVRRLLRTGGDFVDVGAHIGIYTVTAAQALRETGGRVLAIEPHPETRERLLANVRLNGCDNVAIVAAAASSSRGEATLYVPREGQASWASVESSFVSNGQPVRVEQTTVDIAAQGSSISPTLLKIDVEGHELDVLRGMERVLESRPAIIAEVSGQTGPEFARMLASLGYDVLRIMRRTLTPYTPVPGLVNVLAVPGSLRSRL